MKKFSILIISLFLFISTGYTNNSFAGEHSHHGHHHIHSNHSFFTQSVIAKTFQEKQEEVEDTIKDQIQTFKDKKSLLMFLSIAIGAFLFGVFHALAPGTGKTVMFSYFLSQKDKPWRVVLMAAQIAFTHIISSIALVLIADVSIKTITKTPEAQMFWLTTLSYSMIVMIGLYMLYKKIRSINNEGVHCSCSCHTNPTTLAIATGLVPCYGTLIVMLYALANQILFLGILIVFLKAVGITFTLSIIGFLTMYARDLVEKFTKEGFKNKFLDAVEYIGPILIISAGALLLISSFS